MDATTLNLYRQIRKPRIHDYYRTSQAPANGALRFAKELAKVRKQWDAAENAGLVRLSAEPDEEWRGWDDLEGDTYDVELNAPGHHGGERTIKAEQKAFREKVERDGVVGVVGRFRVSPEGPWKIGDSIWGFAGYDDPLNPLENDYVFDIMRTTLDTLRDELKGRCPACRRAA